MEKSGFLVWNGNLRAGETLTLDNGKVTAGLLAGRLPGKPVTAWVYPARWVKAQVVAFTSDPGHATPHRVPTPAGRVSLTFDPRHSTDLAVFEQPNPTNHWERLTLRANSDITTCVIAWRVLD